MSRKKLQLNKESLARLQEDQLRELTGGASDDTWGSNVIKAPEAIEDGDDDDTGSSCCSKSC